MHLDYMLVNERDAPGLYVSVYASGISEMHLDYMLVNERDAPVLYASE